MELHELFSCISVMGLLPVICKQRRKRKKGSLLSSRHFPCWGEGETKRRGHFCFSTPTLGPPLIKIIFIGNFDIFFLFGPPHSVRWFCPCLLDDFTFPRDFIPGFIYFHYLILCSSWFLYCCFNVSILVVACIPSFFT